MKYVPSLSPTNVKTGLVLIAALLAYQIVVVPGISRISPRTAQRLN